MEALPRSAPCCKEEVVPCMVLDVVSVPCPRFTRNEAPCMWFSRDDTLLHARELLTPSGDVATGAPAFELLADSAFVSSVPVVSPGEKQENSRSWGISFGVGTEDRRASVFTLEWSLL